MTGTGWSCGHFEDGWGTCAARAVGRFLPGYRCPRHTPAALAGRPETVPDPALTLDGIRSAAFKARGYETPPPMTPSGETLVDQRAIASGKRRSSPQRFRDARAAVTPDRQEKPRA